MEQNVGKCLTKKRRKKNSRNGVLPKIASKREDIRNEEKIRRSGTKGAVQTCRSN